MNIYKKLDIFLQNEKPLTKVACNILSHYDLQGYLEDWLTKGQIIRRAYPEFKKWEIDTETARKHLNKAFDLLLDFNKTL